MDYRFVEINGLYAADIQFLFPVGYHAVSVYELAVFDPKTRPELIEEIISTEKYDSEDKYTPEIRKYFWETLPEKMASLELNRTIMIGIHKFLKPLTKLPK